ncbi:MGH1-like glycoside hydrolase domain-containing protein [Paradevosia shaoguanensis]|uniref:MGH1-like glycoside hydrolase domain-containing protein n=1 Tax=Paradevosia shaoguanensis TaxID=1335043 RepID=UPI003C7461F8
MKVDELLKTGRRGLRTRPGTLLLGSTGARLWADYLDDAPGFSGALDFIHKINMPLLFSVESDGRTATVPSEVEWRPSHLTSRTSFGDLSLEERKFITWEDEAISIQRWHNGSDKPVTLRVRIDSEWVHGDGAVARGERLIEAHGFTLLTVIAVNEPGLWTGLTIPSGTSVDLVIAAAVGIAESDDWTMLAAKATKAAATPGAALLTSQRAAYQSFFDQVPHFSSSSPVLDRLYAYRWYLMRHTLARPGLAPLDGSLFYEGRSHKMTKAPWSPVGWEFSKLIPLSTPMHLLEARWHHDPHLIDGLFHILAGAQRGDGQFDARTLTRTIHPYANFMGWGTYQYALAKGLDDNTRAALPLLKAQVRGESEFLTTAGDNLPIQQRHQLTGKEYQPSYWYFHDYPDDPFDQSTYTPLKRVDRAIYQYLNACGTAALCRLAGDAEAAEFDALANAIAKDVLAKQWDVDTAFFYDLHHATDEKAMVRNIVGFYPWWAEITGAEHLSGFLAALGPDEFDTPNPFPSVSPQCPVFQSGGSWKGQFFKGRNGCMWDGPTWPYTNSVVLDAIGKVTRSNAHAQDDLFSHFFWKYALLHFQQRDGVTPYLVEHYDSMTGEPISDEADYNHSYLIDLIIRHVAGLSIAADGSITADPIDIGLEHFTLSNVKLGPRNVTIRFDRSSGTLLNVENGDN